MICQIFAQTSLSLKSWSQLFSAFASINARSIATKRQASKAATSRPFVTTKSASTCYIALTLADRSSAWKSALFFDENWATLISELLQHFGIWLKRQKRRIKRTNLVFKMNWLLLWQQPPAHSQFSICKAPLGVVTSAEIQHRHLWMQCTDTVCLCLLQTFVPESFEVHLQIQVSFITKQALVATSASAYISMV